MMQQLERETPAYPNCQNAIKWLDQQGTIEELRDVYGDSLRGLPINSILFALQSACSAVDDDLLKLAEPEMATEDFRRWLLATIYGAM